MDPEENAKGCQPVIDDHHMYSTNDSFTLASAHHIVENKETCH